MHSAEFLLEYLKEQYAQARQHETRQTSATALLTGAAGVVLTLTFTDGAPASQSGWLGAVVFGIGLANFWLNRAHFVAGRVHADLAGDVRKAIEASITDWPTDPKMRPTAMRKQVLIDHKLGEDAKLGHIVYDAIQLIPIGVMVVGVAFAVASYFHLFGS